MDLVRHARVDINAKSVNDNVHLAVLKLQSDMLQFKLNIQLLPNKRSGFFKAHMESMREFLMKTPFCFSKNAFIGCTAFLACLFAQNMMLMKLLYDSDDLYMISLAQNAGKNFLPDPRSTLMKGEVSCARNIGSF